MPFSAFPAFRRLLTLLAFLPAGCALHASSASTPAAAAPDPAGGDLTIAQLHDDLANGRTTPRAVTEHYIARIAAIDTNGPALHAILEVNPDATSIAERAPHGPLFGVPILLKDNIDTADRMSTTAGSLALTGSKPARDAFIVRRLRASGAVILGKTNLSEWANFRSTRSSSGWSGRGGQTKNPYALDRNPCGSSSGSGAAIAAGLAVVAVGSETDGSIVCPSSANGLVGIKPTIGLVSRSGIIPISASQDTAGPMARTVADAAALLTVLSGYDPDDPATAPLRDKPPTDYTHSLNADSLKGVRIGVMRHYAGFHEKVDAVFEQALATLRARGAVLVDPVIITTAEKLDTDEQIVLQYEFKDGINRYLATRQPLALDAVPSRNAAPIQDPTQTQDPTPTRDTTPARGAAPTQDPAPTRDAIPADAATLGPPPRTLADLITFDTNHAATEMPYFGQETFLQSNARGPLTDSTYIEARDRARRLAGPEGIDAALAKDHLDVLIAPTLGPAWTTDLVNGDHFLGGNVSTAPAVAGYPHVTVPMGAVEGLPIGLSFVGTSWSESKLIAYAYAFEQATHARRPPTFPVTLPTSR